MRCDTRAHTRQVVAVVALMILRAYGSPGETQRRVPDVDCKYPTVVSTTRVGVWLSPSHPFHVIAPCVLFKVFPENFPDLLRYKATAQKIIILLFGCDLDCLRGTMGGDRHDYLEAADDKYLSFVCTSPGRCKRCWATGFTITPHLAWWWDINKRSLDQLKIPRHKYNLKNNIRTVGQNKLLRDESGLRSRIATNQRPPMPLGM